MMKTLEVEVVRKEFNSFIDQYPITLKYIAELMKWDYTTLIKFKNGQENYGQFRLHQLTEFIDIYKKAIDSIEH